MKYIKYVIIYLIILLLDATVIDLISIQNVKPDIFLVFLMFLSLKDTQSSSTILGFMVGLLQDLLTHSMLGIFSLSKTISCYVASYFKITKGIYSVLYLALVFFITAIVHGVIFQLIMSIGTEQHFFKEFLTIMLPQSVYTAVVGLIANFLLHRFIWRYKEV